MAPSHSLQRNIRPSKIVDEAQYEHSSPDEDSDRSDVEENTAELDEKLSDASPSEDEDDFQGRSADDGDAEVLSVDRQISSVSFGALLEAQNVLSKKRKRGSENAVEREAKLDTLRARLQEIRSQKHADQDSRGSGLNPSKPVKPALSHNPYGRHPRSDDEVEDDSDSAPSEEDAPTKSRTSKHAPASQTSKRQVTRKRTVVDVPKRVIRDPRFDALNQSAIHQGNSEKAYGFLQDYQKDEIAELKAAIKQTRNEDDKEVLKRKVGSMENRLKAKQAKEREQEVLRKHRKEELEKVQQGKKPFFLKKKDLKERVLVEKFKGMKSKDREKLIEKRRKKESQKEMKRMPDARRLAG